MKTFGQVTTTENKFVILCGANTRIRLKALFPRINKFEFSAITIENTPETCRDLDWFFERFPMEIDDATAWLIRDGSAGHREVQDEMERVLARDYKPKTYRLAKPLRHYQAVAVDLHMRTKSLLLTDELGLGKTVTALGSFAAKGTLPALVVCPTHLAQQWRNDFIKVFLPTATTHIIRRGPLYSLPSVSVMIITYSKLAKWADVLRERGYKSIVFDEVQELRHQGTGKYFAATAIRETCDYAMGLSATPIYNYGGEIYSILKLLSPDRVPNWSEFNREWCTPIGKNNYAIKEPEAFGQYLRDEFLMLRRRREEVGLELPQVQRDIATIPHNADALKEVQSDATELARLVLEGTFLQSGQAAREFDIKLRQATGVSKAPFVADFVRMLAESGEKIVLFGWHREVYSVYLERLADCRPLLYTGSESPAQKAEAIRRFKSKGRDGCDVLIMSLRSGLGIDGLQTVSRTCVFGELDWSPGVHDQCLSSDTEILTRTGFVGPDRVNIGDEVAGFNASDGSIRWVKATDKITRPLADNEEMFATKTEKTDIRVTGNHRMVVRRKTRTVMGVGRSDWDFQEASKLSCQARRFIPVSGDERAAGLPLSDSELRLLGWFITDGYFNGRQLCIYQAAHQPWNADLVGCLNDCGVTWARYQHRNQNGTLMNIYQIPKGNLQRWSASEIATLEEMISAGHSKAIIGERLDRTASAVYKKRKKLRAGDGVMEPVIKRTEKGCQHLEAYFDKNMSPLLDGMTRAQLTHFLHGVRMGDGAKSQQLKNVIRVTNTNKKFLDRLQSLCVRRGFSANISERKQKTKNGRDVFDIYIASAKEASLPRGSKANAFSKTQSYPNEQVWCVTNELGTLVTRRNGRVAIVGNCIGRLNRDGLIGGVIAYFLISDAGSDPTIASVLGLKSAQARSVVDPDKARVAPDFSQSAGERVKQLARDYLERRK